MISVCSRWVDGPKGELSVQLKSRHVNMIWDLKGETASKMEIQNLQEMKTESGNPCPSFGVMFMVITSDSHCAKPLFFSWSQFSLVSFSPRRLDANHINYVPPNCFNGLVSLRHLWLDDNSLTEIPVQAFRSLPALQAMTLALNKIHYIPDYAFGNLSSLVVL